MLANPSNAPILGPPLRKRGVCMTVSAALCVVLALVALMQLSVLASLPPDIAGVFLTALVLSGLLAVVPLALLWLLDRRERASVWLFAAAFLWGGCIATALALPFNTAFFQLIDAWVARHPAVTMVLGPDAAVLLAAPLSAPVVEESAKALGVLLIFWFLRAEFDNMRDGFVYGAAVGVGFNWSETALYVAQGYVQSGVAPFGQELGGRYALLGLALQTSRRWLRIVAPIVGIILAIAAHMLNNSLPLLAALAGAAAGEPPAGREPAADMGFLDAFLSGTVLQLVVFLPFLLITGLALWRSGVWERRVIREELAGEVGHAVHQDEYQQIVRDRILRRRGTGGMPPRLSSALVNAQHELAFRKRRVRIDGKDPHRDRLANYWREEIQRLRQVPS